MLSVFDLDQGVVKWFFWKMLQSRCRGLQVGRVVTVGVTGWHTRAMNTPDLRNLLQPLPTRLDAEIFETVMAAPGLRVERILSQGQSSPPDVWYDQDEAEWVVVLQGRARLQFETGMVALAAGDALNIPAHVRHRVDWTDPDQVTVWLAVFYRMDDGSVVTAP